MKTKSSGKKVAEQHLIKSEFISEVAKLRYEQGMKQKTFAVEKGFVISDGKHTGYPSYVSSVILEQKWTRFCARPKEVIMNLVLEFYANFEGELPEMVRVRKRKVKISPAAINSFYNLEEVEDEFYVHADNHSPTYLKAVLKEIAEPNTEWVISKTGSFSLPRIALLPKAKVWYHFLKSRIFPSSHGQHVTKDRAVLLYCILTGKRINIGMIIYRNLCANALKTKGQFFFPSLITGLCELARVVYEEWEDKLALASGFTPLAVKRITLNKSGEEEVDEDEEPRKKKSHNLDDASEAVTSAESTVYQQQIMESLRLIDEKLAKQQKSLLMMEQRMSQQEVQQYHINTKLHRFKRKSKIFWHYTKLRDKAIAEVIQ